MASIESHLYIQASPEKVYQVSQDYRVRYEWDPFPERIEQRSTQLDLHIGSQVQVYAKNGLKMLVEFVQISPPQRAAIKMVQGPFFLESFAGSWVFKADARGGTLAYFKYSLRMKPWFMPFISEKIATWYFERIVHARLLGLKRYCEHLHRE